MDWIVEHRRGRVLTKARFGCLRDTYTLNVTRGCEFQCVYCYARGYPEAPVPGEVYVYTNLPQRLVEELDRPRRRSSIRWVAFNTSSDSFQSHPLVLEASYGAMKALLERGIGFSFLTKGWIPERFLRLFEKSPDRVFAKIGLVSTNQSYRDLFEPLAASPFDRLRNLQRLKEVGIETEVRIDPVIPFYTDDEASIRSLYQALAERGVERVTLSYLHLRPAVFEQLRRELPLTEFKVLRSCYETRPWTTVGGTSRSKLLPLALRQKGYHRFKVLAKPFGIRPQICSCKNPELRAQRCSIAPAIRDGRPSRAIGSGQLSLFPC